MEVNPQNNSTNNADRIYLGVVGSPQGQEATSQEFSFWVQRTILVEETQVVVCESTIAGRPYRFYGIINQVYRRSRKRNMDEEFDQSDGDIDYVPPFESDGYTYARVGLLCVQPAALTPPLERSKVYLANEEDTAVAYGADEITEGSELALGLVKNGGNQLAGPGKIDLDYLLGTNGGHLNVNGSAGRGTKSSFLLHANWVLLKHVRHLARTYPSLSTRREIVPIILNVKNYDLFYIDQRSRRYSETEHLADWVQLGVDMPQPFQHVSFYAPQQPNLAVPVATGRPGVKAYSWSLADIIKLGLFSYLFAEEDANDANFSALILDIENLLTAEKLKGDTTERQIQPDGPARTFQELLDWVDNHCRGGNELRNHHLGTWKKFYRRLFRVVRESKGVLRHDELQGQPLNVARKETSDPIVVDLSALAATPELQRFVVATIFRQLIEARTGVNVVRNLVYIVTLDELNRFAPKGARDSITQLIEMVASEMRSQGIILFGAQQQASKVSEKVIENAAIRVLGRTGALELNMPVWKFLSQSAKGRAMTLQTSEKLIIQDNFREPMLVRIPFPAWAMNPDEALVEDSEDYSDLLRGV
ncbi:MAG: ATP-binding protein [Ktedonobacteraceae bacterium]|nr:ATP-binding protein [Ktedonobacteraceae bacterium]